MTYALPKRRQRQPMGLREPDRVDCKSHLRWVRGFECAIAGKADHVCQGRMEAHHDRQGLTGGAGLKPGDDKAVPLCSAAHMEGDNRGWITFAAKYRVDFEKLSAELWRQSPHRLKYERSLQETP